MVERMVTALQKNLRSQIKEKNLSVHALEKKSGLKPGAIQNILQGKSKKPSADLIFSIAQQLGCSVEELLQTNLAVPSKTQRKKWIPSLYMDALKVVNSILSDRELQFSKEALLNLVDETYLYSLEGNFDKADQKFAEWLISKSSV